METGKILLGEQVKFLGYKRNFWVVAFLCFARMLICIAMYGCNAHV